MKALKIIGFVVGGIVVLLAIAVAVALTPSVQTWAVRKAVAGQPGMTLEVSRVAAGLSAAEISDLKFSQNGLVITAKGVSARYSAWDFLTKNKLNADDVSVQELVVDLRNVPPASPAPGQNSSAVNAPANAGPNAPPAKTAAATPPPSAKSAPASKGSTPAQPFEGVLKAAKLPFDVRVAQLAAKGRALLSKNQTVVFDVKGSGIETGQRGKLEWVVDFADAAPEAALRGLRATGTAFVHIAADQRVDLVELETTAAAMGPKLPSDRVRLGAKLEAPTAGGNEGYAATVSLLRGSAVEPLVKTTAQFVAASREISGAWEIAVRTEQLAAVLAGLGLPEIAAAGGGRFNLKPETAAVSATGDLQGSASKLAQLSPSLAGIGSAQFKVSFDGGLAQEVAQLNKLNLEVTGADGRKFADISTVQRVGYELATGRVTFADAKAELARINVQALPLAWAQPALPDIAVESGDLSLALAVEAEPDGSRVRVRALEPLAIRTVTLRQGRQVLVDRVTLTARPSVDYSATRIVAEISELNVSMPAGDAVTGKLAAEITNHATKPAIAFSSQLQAKIVTALKPFLPVDTGTLTIATVTEGRFENNIVQLAKASSTVSRDNGALLVAFETQQPLRINLQTTTLAGSSPDKPAVRLRLGEVPLAWAEPFVANSKLAGALTGGTFDVAIRSFNDLSLATAAPLTLRGVTVALDGKPTLNAVDLSCTLNATKKGNVIGYDLRRAEVKQGETLLAGLSVTGEATLGGAKPSIAAKGTFEADVPALTRQPALASFATLSKGNVTAVFDARHADATQAKAVISAKNLVAKADNRVLGDLEVNLDATVKPDGSGTIAAPITLTNASRKSDISITGAFGRTADQKTFLLTGKVASSNLVVDDFEPLAGLAPKSEPAPAARPGTSTPGTPPRTTTPPRPAQPPVAGPTTPGRDTQPFWKGVNGKVEVDLKRILYGKDYVISGVRGTAVITDTRLSLDGLEGRFKENPFKVSGGLTFAPQQAKPYSLIGSADVTNFDVGAFLRAASPNELPAIETTATLSARLNGSGATLADVGKNAFGKFELTGTKGVARYLARKGTAGTVVNALTTGLAILGAARGSDTTMAIAEIARLLNEVHFDSIKMQVDRAADLSFKLTSMEVLSPIVRMTGTGAVASKSTDDLATAPMNIVLQLGAKGELAHLFGRIGMLAGVQTASGVQAKTDEKGYALMTRTFTIGGTASKPDSGALWKILGEAAAGGLSELLNRR